MRVSHRDGRDRVRALALSQRVPEGDQRRARVRLRRQAQERLVELRIGALLRGTSHQPVGEAGGQRLDWRGERLFESVRVADQVTRVNAEEPREELTTAR